MLNTTTSSGESSSSSSSSDDDSSKCPSGTTLAKDSTGYETCYLLDSAHLVDQETVSEHCSDHSGGFPSEFYSDEQVQ